MKRRNKGITLVALVITIIILLILAGISIASLTGSGLFEKAKLSAQESKKAEIQEKIQMAVNDILIDCLQEGKEATNQNIKEKLENNEFVDGIIVNDDLTGTYEGYSYYIDENNKVHVGEESDEVQLAKITVKEEKRKITATVTDAQEILSKIEIIAPDGTVLSTKDLEDGATAGKLENCIANKSGRYNVKVTTKENNTIEKAITVKPLQISNKQELISFGEMVNSGVTFEGDTVTIVADIDLGETTESSNWTPIGYFNSNEDYIAFKGILDGKNHTIKNMKTGTAASISSTSTYGIGFFSTLENGTIKNLNFDNASVDTATLATGIVVGYAWGTDANDAIIENVKITNGNISATVSDVAGICGETENAIIRNCAIVDTNIISTSYRVGGIVGINIWSTVENCYNVKTVGSENGIVKGSDRVGGILGTNNQDSVLRNCYNTSDVVGESVTGGIVGRNGEPAQKVENVFNAGTVKCGDTIVNKDIGDGTNNLTGRIIGNNVGTLTGKYSNTTIEAMQGWNEATILENLGSGFKKNTNLTIINGLPLLSFE